MELLFHSKNNRKGENYNDRDGNVYTRTNGHIIYSG